MSAAAAGTHRWRGLQWLREPHGQRRAPDPEDDQHRCRAGKRGLERPRRPLARDVVEAGGAYVVGWWRTMRATDRPTLAGDQFLLVIQQRPVLDKLSRSKRSGHGRSSSRGAGHTAAPNYPTCISVQDPHGLRLVTRLSGTPSTA